MHTYNISAIWRLCKREKRKLTHGQSPTITVELALGWFLTRLG
jgi:hypothetical protein